MIAAEKVCISLSEMLVIVMLSISLLIVRQND